MAQSGNKDKGRGRRRAYTTRIGDVIPPEARKEFRRRGFAESQTITRWHEIVGRELAQFTLPLRISTPRGKKGPGVLHLMSEGAYATHLQHLAPVLIERINAFHGFASVGSLKIHHGRVADAQPGTEPPPPLDAESRALLDALLDSVQNDRLKKSLRNLGQSVLAGSESDKSS